jgi:hypothetical protein
MNTLFNLLALLSVNLWFDRQVTKCTWGKSEEYQNSLDDQ